MVHWRVAAALILVIYFAGKSIQKTDSSKVSETKVDFLQVHLLLADTAMGIRTIMTTTKTRRSSIRGRPTFRRMRSWRRTLSTCRPNMPKQNRTNTVTAMPIHILTVDMDMAILMEAMVTLTDLLNVSYLLRSEKQLANGFTKTGTTTTKRSQGKNAPVSIFENQNLISMFISEPMSGLAPWCRRWPSAWRRLYSCSSSR